MLLSRRYQNIGFVKTNLLNLFLLVMVVGFTSCTKKRDESFVQGQGQDLISINELDNKMFNVETLNEIGAIGSSSDSTKVKEDALTTRSTKIDAKNGYTNWKLTPVKIKTDAELVGDIPFVARANDKTSYKIQYKINNSYLVVYKLAEKANLHPKEIPGAIKSDDTSTLAIPLVAYPILGFYNVENALQNEEKSNKLIEMPAREKEKAKFIKLDRNARVIYKLQEKLDVFPKDYFTGDWYHAQTIIATDLRNTESTGFSILDQDQDLNSTSKIRFTYNNKELRIITIAANKAIDTTDELNQNVIASIPIDWKEYRPVPRGKDFEMMEEEVDTMVWNKKNYMKLDFESINSLAGINGNVRLVDLELDNNYFSFTVQGNNNAYRVKFSFLKTEGRKAYKPKLHLEKDFDKFGFFTTHKAKENLYDEYKKSDIEKKTFINRFNVANGEVIYYFTNGSDPKLMPAAIQAVEGWNDGFAKAGVPLKIKVDTTKRVGLGDLRYNAINIISSTQEYGLGGFGPSVSDPDTGEIISATTNMHITTYQSIIVSEIRNLILSKRGMTKDANIFVEPVEYSMPKVQVVAGNGGATSTPNKLVTSAASSKKYFIKKLPFLDAGNKLTFIDVEAPKEEAKVLLRKSKNWGREFTLGLSGKNLQEEIDKKCPEINSLVEKINAKQQIDNENSIIVACADKIVPAKMLNTFLHEMGHNLGLRHNFTGSNDSINFFTKEETKTAEKVRSSTVMEYLSFNDIELPMIGKYDIAAIRYGYGDAVETKEGEIVKLDTSKSIDENLAAKNTKARPFKFCTDEDVELNEDPMCDRHDSGETPQEVVKTIIKDYNSSIAMYNYRFDRAQNIDPMRLTNYRVRRYWVNLKRFYDEWRFKLVDYLGQGNEYLDNFSAKSYAEKLNDMKNDKDFSETYNLYKPAADEIFKFAMQVATLPGRYCIGERNGQMASIDFSEVRTAVYNLTKSKEGKVIKTCLDADAIAYIKDKKGFVPVTESGYELEDVRYNMDAKAAKEPYDIIGLMPEKNIAVTVLTVRAALSQKYSEKSFLPNFMDEPDNRDVLLAYLADRLSKGVASERLIKSANKGFLEKFKNDKRYIENLVSSIFYDGLEVPEKDFATRKRKKKFAMKYTDKKETLEKAVKKVLGPDGTSSYVVIEPEATEAIKLLEKLETLPARIAAAVPVTDETFLGLMELARTELVGKPNEKLDHIKFGRFLHLVLDDEFNPSKDNRGYTRPKEQKENDKNRVHWKKMLLAESGIMREYLSSAFDSKQNDGNLPSDWTAYYDTVGKLVIEKLVAQNKDYTLDMKSLEARVDEYVKANKTKPGDVVSSDIYEYDELQTQYELILSLLRRISEY